ncbi:cyclic lactone autoinducer peptide [Listeria rocourtiae]|uniref:cyclic lactone autoinducer peptide n=1 Tax=Listeria rocourtiae TaxID=647910 RepID=UPI0016233061|nr:cyclic lactone autoinducer peptide [Listeria rocourtiae]MBC1605043.1 cyclic lactone autoinducer peptide [Listeria rocourtiae]
MKKNKMNIEFFKYKITEQMEQKFSKLAEKSVKKACSLYVYEPQVPKILIQNEE